MFLSLETLSTRSREEDQKKRERMEEWKKDTSKLFHCGEFRNETKRRWRKRRKRSRMTELDFDLTTLQYLEFHLSIIISGRDKT